MESVKEVRGKGRDIDDRVSVTKYDGIGRRERRISINKARFRGEVADEV